MSASEIPEAIRRWMGRHPTLWLGAGVSQQADPPLPTPWQLVAGLREGFGWDPLPEVDDPYLLFDRGLASGIFQPEDLHDYLEDRLRPGGRDPAPGALHRHLAELAADGAFPFIVDTNYDLLLRRAMQDIRAPHTHSVLEQNLARPTTHGCWYLSIHGDINDWKHVVLTRASALRFAERHRFLRSQLDLLLIKHPMLFLGHAMTEPALLEWLDGLGPEASQQRKSWMAVLGPGDEERLNRALFKGRPVREVLGQGLTVVELPAFEALPQWFGLLAAPARERRQRAARDLTIEIEAGTDVWRASFATQIVECPPFARSDALARLRVLAGVGLPCTESGDLLEADDTEREREMWSAVRDVGKRISELLPESGREAIASMVGSSAQYGNGLLRIKVRGPESNTALVLPWEVLVIGDHLPVADGRLSVIREAAAEGVEEGLPTPPPVLSVVAHVSAPVHSGLPELNLEEAAYRMARALVSVEDRTLFTDLGTLDDLERAAARLSPVLLHFAGHGVPGHLVFEDLDGGPVQVSAGRLLAALRKAMNRLPGAIWLSCCYSAGTYASGRGERTREWGAPDPRTPSISAELQRAGVPQVLGYFGPVPDPLAVAVDRNLFEVLARTQSTIDAVRDTRLHIQRVIDTGRGWARYPLAWMLLGLYHRGPIVPLAAVNVADDPIPPLTQALEREQEDLHGLEALRHGFIGRRRLLATMRRHRERGRNVLGLWGIGGLGKTAAMIRLARVFSGGQPGWQQHVAVLSLKNLEKSFSALRDNVLHAVRMPAGWDAHLQQVESNEEDRGAPLARALIKALRARVLYVDNAEALQSDPGAEDGAESEVPWCGPEVASFFRTLCREAPSQVTVLITTRYLPPDTPGMWVAIEPCTRDEVFRMMRWLPSLRWLPPSLREELAARHLAGHPRAVEWMDALIEEQAARWLADGYDLREITDAELVRANVLAPALAKFRHDTIGPELLLDAIIDRLGPGARALLGECCQIGLPVPLEVVHAIGPGAEALQARGLLTRYEQQGWAVHPFVRNAVKDKGIGWTTTGRAALADHWLSHCRAAGEALDMFWKEALEHSLAARRWSDAKEVVAVLDQGYQQHGWVRARVEFLVGLSSQDWPEAERGFILHRTANALEEVGQLAEAAERSLEAVAIAQRLNLPLELASALHGWASILVRQGKYAEAELTYKQVIALQDGLYATDEHPEFAAPLHGLATLLMKLDRLDEAELLARRALAILDRTLEIREHPDVAKSLLNLAHILKRRAKYPESEAAFREAISIWETLFHTRDHALIATAVDGLAQLLGMQDRHPEAVPLYREAIASKERIYGTSENLSVAASLVGLANALMPQELFDEAAELLEHALAIQRNAYGNIDHLDIAVTLDGLANLAWNRGQHDLAIQYFREEIAIEARVHGTRRGPSTLRTLNKLAELLAMQNRPEEALEYAREAWEGSLAAPLWERAVECGPIFVVVLSMLHQDQRADRVENLLLALLSRLPEDLPLRIETEQKMGLRGRHPAPVSELAGSPARRPPARSPRT